MEYEGSFLSLQQTTIWPSPEPDESSSCPHTISLQGPESPFSFPTKILCVFLISSMCAICPAYIIFIWLSQ